ncbi:MULTISPECIES: hypothetical protein [unclassified Brevundimonas]|uniref:hypothetical protein n=1 Tax=unclassified Brevundimonas TaxID=2622653 RepID=UPI0025BB891C|nr:MULTISPECIES: hypothetical protein [unclassified Brevundimonas]
MRVRFERDRNWTPPEERRITVAYKKDMELTVKRDWGERMVKDGDAVEIDAPVRAKGGAATGPFGNGEKGVEVFVPEKKPLTAAQIKSLDGDRDGNAGGSLPKAKA